MKLKTLMLLGVVLLVQINAYAMRFGSEGGNGGDPVAQAFTYTMIKITLFLEQNPRLLMMASRTQARAVSKQIQDSLGRKNAASLVEVSDQRPHDEFGIEKAAVTTVNPLKIRLHRQSWSQPEMTDRAQVERDKVILAGMELFLLIGLEKDRYALAYGELGTRYRQVLDSEPENAIISPKLPTEANALDEIISVKDYRLVDDYFLQALGNSTFKNCEIKTLGSDSDTRWGVRMFYGKEENFTLYSYFSDGRAKEISRSKDGRKLRGRYKAGSLDGRALSVNWDDESDGYINYTATLSADGTEIKELNVTSYLLSAVNVGSGFYPRQEMKWIKQDYITCQNIK